MTASRGIRRPNVDRTSEVQNPLVLSVELQSLRRAPSQTFVRILYVGTQLEPIQQAHRPNTVQPNYRRLPATRCRIYSGRRECD